MVDFLLGGRIFRQDRHRARPSQHSYGRWVFHLLNNPNLSKACSKPGPTADPYRHGRATWYTSTPTLVAAALHKDTRRQAGMPSDDPEGLAAKVLSFGAKRPYSFFVSSICHSFSAVVVIMPLVRGAITRTMST